MVQDAVFSPKVVIWLITVGLLSFAGAIYFVIYGDEGIARTSGANSFSYSAIGHRAFVETLRRMDVPVLVSRDDSAAKAGRSALLVVAEPRWRAPTDDTVDDLLSADTLLIVLPKWQGRPDEANPRWLKFAVPLPRAEVEETLRRAVPGARVRRIAGSVSWQPGRFGVSPTLSVPQLIETAALTPIVASDRGLLLGELVHGAQRIWILSDPDILSNHGLGRGDNSVLTSRLIDALRPPGWRSDHRRNHSRVPAGLGSLAHVVRVPVRGIHDTGACGHHRPIVGRDRALRRTDPRPALVAAGQDGVDRQYGQPSPIRRPRPGDPPALSKCYTPGRCTPAARAAKPR